MIRRVALVSSLTIFCLFSCKKAEVLPEKEYAEFRGIFLGKNVVFSEKDEKNANISGRISGSGDPRGEYTGYAIGNRLYSAEPINQDYPNNLVIQINMAFLKVYSRGLYGPDSVYSYLKRVLTVGKKEKEPGSYENGFWNIGFSQSGIRNFVWKNREEGATIEIIEVKEVDSKTITSESGYYPKAFWVRYKIKVSFDNYGDINGILKVKYLINYPYTIN